MGRALVIHPGALGDVLLAIPALRALRRRHPRDEIVLAAQSHVGDLLRTVAVIDARVRFERLRLDRLFVDAALDSAVDLRADSVVCWFGASDPTFAKRMREVAADVIVAPPWTTSGRVWEHLVATLGEGAGEADRRPVDVPASVRSDGRCALEAAGWDGMTPLVVVHPGASGAAKRWPVEGYAEVIAAIRARARVAVIVHAGPADHEAASALVRLLDAPTGTLDNPTLDVLAGALGHVSGFFGNDSGVSHLAAAVGVPSLVLFAPERRGWAPWSESATTHVVSMRELARDDVAAATSALRGLLT
jgi:heptosyltransferase-3